MNLNKSILTNDPKKVNPLIFKISDPSYKPETNLVEGKL